MISFLDIFGTFAFAVSGAFRAVKYELDLLGVMVLAIATGVGGGMIRDVLLGLAPPAALTDQKYVLVCVAGAVIVFVAAPKIATRWNYVMAADAVGLSVFAVIGAAKAEANGATAVAVMLMAMITASGGGVIRDVLVLEMPAMLKSDLYASAALIGGGLYVLLGAFDVPETVRVWGTVAATLVLRTLAMRYGLRLPQVKSLRASPSELTREKRSSRK